MHKIGDPTQVIPQFIPGKTSLVCSFPLDPEVVSIIKSAMNIANVWLAKYRCQWHRHLTQAAFYRNWSAVNWVGAVENRLNPGGIHVLTRSKLVPAQALSIDIAGVDHP